MKNIFIIPKGLSTGVINSQMLEIVSNLNMNGEKENFIIVHESDIDKISNPDDIYNSLFLYLFKQTDISNLYVRSLFDFLKAYFLKKTFLKKYKIIYDFRGIINEESYLRNKSKRRKQILFFIEKFIYNKADKIHTVSNRLKHYLEKNFGYRQINVIPCAISNTILKKARKKKYIDFVYLGSVSVWQKFEETIKLYSDIEKRLENTKLTIITLEKDKAKEILKKYNLLNYEVKSLSHQEVLKELSNYDFGFLLRDNNIVNNTASPIKFLEYIANGVIPIMTEGIGDYSSIVQKNKIGIVLDQKFTLDVEKISDMLNDKKIYFRLEEVSSLYLWRNVLKGFYDDQK